MVSAIGIIETSSIAKGFETADAVVKAANVDVIVNRTICPGKYMILFGGDVDAVTASVEAGIQSGAHTVVDHFIIPNIHPSVFPAINGTGALPEIKALGVIEAFTVSAIIEGADAAVKAADIDFLTIHLAMAVGGKGYVSFTGDVGSVEAAVDAGVQVIGSKGLLVEKVVIPSPSKEIVREFI